MNIENVKALQIDKLHKNTYDELTKSDWKVIKHRDQVDDGITPDLTDEEYKSLLDERQSIRDWSNTQEDSINNATTIEDVVAVNIIYGG